MMATLSYSSVSDLRYADAASTKIDCTVVFAHLGKEPVPFTAARADPHCPHSEEIFARALNGEFGPIAQYVPPPVRVPRSVTPAQAKITLFEEGLLEATEALVIAHQYKPVAIWWSNAVQFDRANPYLQGLGVELGLTDEQMDAMFIAASQK